MDSENNPTPPAGSASDAPPAKTDSPSTPPAQTEARTGSGTEGEQATRSDASVETPASTTPAERVVPATGATKTGSTPTPAVSKGIPKAVAAKATGGPAAKPATGAAAAKPAGALVQSTDPPINKMRRRIVWASIAGFLGTSFLMFLRFFLPRATFEPSSIFRIGFPGDYSLGVDTKWQQLYRIWVVKTSDRLFVINAVCTHLGCTPDWKSSENKFKCPCHGSGYDSDGINFEGPAPRPMDRAHIELDAEGQLVVDKGKLYTAPKGEPSEFNEPGSFIQV
ncbi:MAG TPA: Rieske 2Fe-2S domain-containing protein [Pyrinomonadaceae bacterium]|nr:Rieske 2Fe-2S domain-containing protein [Pyrinomonadaceae bacterium]